MPFVNSSGSSNVIVLPAGQKLVASNPGGLVIIFGSNQPSNQPEGFVELARVVNGSVSVGPFGADRNIRVGCGPIGLAEYQTGVAPALVATPFAAAALVDNSAAPGNTTINSTTGRCGERGDGYLRGVLSVEPRAQPKVRFTVLNG